MEKKRSWGIYESYMTGMLQWLDAKCFAEAAAKMKATDNYGSIVITRLNSHNGLRYC